jgi:hypothetical protein
VNVYADCRVGNHSPAVCELNSTIDTPNGNEEGCDSQADKHPYNIPRNVNPPSVLMLFVCEDRTYRSIESDPEDKFNAEKSVDYDGN